MSTTGLTAQAYGAKDPLRLARALVQPLILALGAGVNRSVAYPTD
jgi:MATE family multidrug resistance protein